MNINAMRRSLVVSLVACLVLVAVCNAIACNHGFVDTEETAIVDPPDKSEATFEVDMLPISPEIPMVSDTLTLSAVVKNTGDMGGTYTAILTIDGQEMERKQVAVAPTSSSNIDFLVDKLPAGNHEVAIGGSRTGITVYDWRPYTINYCKGQSDWTLFTADPGTLHGNGGVGQIVHFIVPSVPFKIQQIWINGEVTAQNPQELNARQFKVTIWSKDRSQQLWSEQLPWSLFDNRMNWKRINVPDVRVEDDFYVEVVTGSDPWTGNGAKNYLNIAFEIARDALPEPRSLEYYRKSAFDSHSGWSIDGQPTDPPGRDIRLNWCIRVDGFGKLEPY